MSLPPSDAALIEAELGRDPTPEEAALFENLWSEHCAYRSSRPLLEAFETDGPQVVVGPGDDAAVVSIESAAGREMYLTLGIESHNHPSYVDPFDGAATGVGGIVRDTMSMGAYPIALADCLYFGSFEREHSRYLFEGVVEGISHYGNCIGVPTVGGSVDFHPDYEGNPLVNVACVGLLEPDRLVTAEAQSPGNALVIVGNATGRDGLGGAAFASEDLDEDAETEDRPAVQVGDPYTEKLLIEANEVLLEEGLVQSARDLGAAGLGGATSELVAKGGFGAEIALERLHQREPNMTALELLLAESQERMCYEVRQADVPEVRAIADRFDLGCAVVGEVTEGNYVCTFEGEVVVDVDAAFLGEGAPPHDLPHESPPEPARDRPDVELDAAVETLLESPNTVSREWVYRQYDHEVGVRTAVGPGDDAAVLAIPETGTAPGRDSPAAADGAGLGLVLSAGAAPHWTSVAPFEGARAVALENATNLAAKGARPHAAVNCLNGGNPETPAVYGGFRGIVEGLADMCETLEVPIVGGNVSLYNDSPSGPIPPTPTLAMVGVREGYDAPPSTVEPGLDLLVIDDRTAAEGPVRLGGSELLARTGGSDRFPTLPSDPRSHVAQLTRVAGLETTVATHDVSQGGLLVTLAEMVGEEAGIAVDLERATVASDSDPPGDGATAPSLDYGNPVATLAAERPGRMVVATTDPDDLIAALGASTVAIPIGHTTEESRLHVDTARGTVSLNHAEILDRRDLLERELEGSTPTAGAE